MINSRQAAVIKKDIWSVTSNKSLMTGLIILPIIFSVFLPALFVLMLHFAPEQLDDIETILDMLPAGMISDDLSHTFLIFLLDYVLPIFFILIPILVSTITAASSFAGEKEKRTLETLLYSPLSLSQIYQSKVWASFLLSMALTFASFIVMLIVVEVCLLLTSGSMILPGISWLITLLVVSPTASLLAVALIVIGSAKAKTMEDAQQRAALFIMPIIVLMVCQFTGFMLVNELILLAMGALMGAVSFFMMKRSMRNFTYEKLLK